MDGFGTHREAARRGIDLAGGTPILIEDFPSLPASPRTACLDAVASSDVYVVIVGERGGWRAPSGKLVVEEEYAEARRRGLPVIYLRAAVERDNDALHLDRELSDYVSGFYRRTFHSIEELEGQVRDALQSVLAGLNSVGVASMSVIEDRLRTNRNFNTGAFLQTVVAPQRLDEVVNAVTIGSEAFRRSVLEIGHARNVDLFDFAIAKEVQLDVASDTLTIKQRAQVQVLGDVQVSITPAGVVDTLVSVTGRQRGGKQTTSSGMVILEQDVKSALASCLAFARELYEFVDPYQRYALLSWNTALHHQGHQPLLREDPHGSFSVPMNVPRPAIAFPSPRAITRLDLGAPKPLVEDSLVMLRRRFGES